MSWGEKIADAKNKTTQMALIQEAVDDYGRRMTRMVNETPLCDMPFLMAMMRRTADALDVVIGEDGSAAARELEAMTKTIAIDLDEMRRQGE